ncbi:uncharacterized protein LOC127054257 isoform X1 [Gopherus flavomarginatus]|uniref:uncharacterized protein LOC127054257 isoform X1 n=2 Tax=Gopherus flavomarginatus TaxID=286002 RepID=UPI0021CBCAA4|nr:uncharacterized protein LOC127054257 isoform X1 [Gopherus flavomarginatus]
MGVGRREVLEIDSANTTCTLWKRSTLQREVKVCTPDFKEMHFLSFLLTFVMAMTLSSAQCFYEPIPDKQVSNEKGCFRDGEMHDFGVYWYTKDCLRCYCTREVVSCCNITLTPVGYDQEKCESVFDVESCSYQKFLLFLFLVLLTFGSLCTAQCYMRTPNKYGCVENRKLYHFGVVWKTKDCFRCECQPRAMICCSLVFRPTNYDRENCIAMFHKKSCSMRVVWKSDPQEPCNVFAGVG